MVIYDFRGAPDKLVSRLGSMIPVDLSPKHKDANVISDPDPEIRIQIKILGSVHMFGPNGVHCCIIENRLTILNGKQIPVIISHLTSLKRRGAQNMIQKYLNQSELTIQPN